jgi:DNA-binding SARP family transcriptional activator
LIRFSGLGGLDLRTPDDRQLLSVLAQPKRTAILVYLALARPAGFQRRDRLLALFWPEHDERRARDSLNTSLSYLRNSLGAGVVQARGAEEVGLDQARIRVDAVEFEAALEAGRLEEALELYRGDLLPGFHIPAAPEFERWLEAERGRLRVRAREAAWALAVRAREVAGPEAAVMAARRVLQVAPDDERALRTLISLLDASGDRAGALREYDAFAARIAADHDAEPAPETRDLVEAVRAREVPLRVPAESSDKIAGGAPAGAAGEFVSEAKRAVATVVLGGGGGARTPQVGVRAIFIAAAIMIMIAAGVFLRSIAADADSAGPMPEPGPRERAGGMVVPATRSVAALEAYREGESASRRGDYEMAVRAFRRAVEADTGFAVGFLRLSAVADWIGDADLARWAAEQALGRVDALADTDALLVRAQHAYLLSEPARAESLYVEIVTRAVDRDAWFHLGETRYHWMPTLGRPATASRSAWEHVLSLDPEHIGALLHLIRVLAIDGHRAEVDSLTARLLAIKPTGAQALEVRILRAALLDDDEAWRLALAALDQTDAATIRGIIRHIASVAYRPDLAAMLARRLIEPEWPADVRVYGQLLLAQLESARGRAAAADSALDRSAWLPPARALEYRAALLTQPFRQPDAAELDRTRRALERLPAEAFIGPRVSFLAADAIYPPRRHYLLGLLAIRANHFEAASQHAMALERFGGRTPIDDGFAAGFARLLRASIEHARGRPRRALELLGEPEIPVDKIWPDLPSYPLAQERWLRAELHRELGEDAAALRWYATFPDPHAYDLAYLAPAHLRQAQIYERQGAVERAAWHRGRAAELWRDADPALWLMAEGGTPAPTADGDASIGE